MERFNTRHKENYRTDLKLEIRVKVMSEERAMHGLRARSMHR